MRKTCFYKTRDSNRETLNAQHSKRLLAVTTY